MLRDEPAEMAWGVERTVVGASGSPLDRALVWRTDATCRRAAVINRHCSLQARFDRAGLLDSIPTDSRGRWAFAVAPGQDCPLLRQDPKGSCLLIPTRRSSSRNSLARASISSAAIALLAGWTVQLAYGSDGFDQRAGVKDAAACASTIWTSSRKSMSGATARSNRGAGCREKKVSGIESEGKFFSRYARLQNRSRPSTAGI